MLNTEHKHYEFDGVNWVEYKPKIKSLDYVYDSFISPSLVYCPYIPISEIENDDD